MKKLFSIAVCVVLLLGITTLAFGGGGQEEPPKPATMGPQRGGTIRFAIAEESRGLDPVTAHRYFSETAIQVHDGLVVFGEDNTPYGQLAESWSANASATEYTIKLRDDVVFHDGTKLTGKDVQAHFARVFDPQFCCGNAYQYMGPYTETELIDDYTIKIKFSKSWGPFNYYVGLLDVTAIPSNASWDRKGDKMNLDPVGAGPFKFVEWVPQSHIKFERFAEYNWGADMFENKGAPYVDALEIRFVADQSTRVASLESGNMDIIKAPAYTDMQRLRDNPRFKLVRIPQTGMPFSFVFNTAKWPTSELQVRKAINLAIDREKINMAAFLGEREPLYTTLTPSTLEYWPGAKDLIYFDPDEAKKILSGAGWRDSNGDGILEKNGRPLEIDLYVFGSKEANPSVIAAESMQSDLKAVGVKVNLSVRPWDDQSVIAMKEEHHLINFDMPLPTASVLGVMFNSRETPREGHYGMGFTWFEKGNPSLSRKLDQLLDAGDNAANMEARKENFIEAQKIIGNNYLGVPISAGFVTYAMVNELMGVKYNNAGHAMFNDAYFAK
jgi:peptide/nickel transport system substrate-binding protein